MEKLLIDRSELKVWFTPLMEACQQKGTTIEYGRLRNNKGKGYSYAVLQDDEIMFEALESEVVWKWLSDYLDF